MRKIFIILTLIVSSFFIFNNDVKADTTTYNVNLTHFDYLNDEFYLLREKVIEYSNENNMYYLIVYKSGEFNAYVFEKKEYTIDFNDFNGSVYININSSSKICEIYDETLNCSGNSTSITFSLVAKYSSTSISYLNYLDSNIESLKYTGSVDFNISYNDLLYSVTLNGTVPSLYQIYLDDTYVEPEPEPEDPHLEEKEKLSNFYTTVITKIGELATNVFNNFILLFVIGIFVFIFIFEIIFRRLL